MKKLLLLFTFLFYFIFSGSTQPPTKQAIIKSKLKEIMVNVTSKRGDQNVKFTFIDLTITDAREIDGDLYTIGTVTEKLSLFINGNFYKEEMRSYSFIAKIKEVLEEYAVQEIRFRDPKTDNGKPFDYIKIHFNNQPEGRLYP